METRTRVAAYALVRDGGRLLMCRVSASVESHQPWTLPGGGLEFGESPEAAAVREVREETGLVVRLTGLAGIDSETFDLPWGAMHGLRVVYWAEAVGGELRDEREGSTDRARFLAPAEARALPLVSLASRGLAWAFPFEVRALGAADARAYWDLRLEALDAEPLAFGSSTEDHLKDGFEAVTARVLKDEAHGAFMLGAFEGERMVGMVGLVRSERAKTRHLAAVVSMYVTASARGRGAGRALLGALIDRARGYDGLEGIELSVTTQAAAARALYLSLGFVPFGVQRRALKFGDVYADMEHMSLALRPA